MFPEGEHDADEEEEGRKESSEEDDEEGRQEEEQEVARLVRAASLEAARGPPPRYAVRSGPHPCHIRAHR